MEADPRLVRIHQQIKRFIAADYSVREPAAENGDEIDAILDSLNTLEDQLEERKEKISRDDERIQSLMNLLLRYTILDFNELAPISEEGDEIDAIAAGLNALREEITYSMNIRKKNENELQEKANQLETANKEMEAFTYTVSHDLRSPLRAIHGYSQVLLEDFGKKLDDEGQRVLQAVMDNAERMGKLIDDLLEFSRLGRKEINKEEIDPVRLTENVYQELAEQNSRAEVTIQPMPLMTADYSLMRQVFQNLISNALKFSSNREVPRIEVGATDTEQGRVFFVKDNGAGFDMNYYDKMFGVFQRLHREEEFEGTGVGLAIVKRILQRHGGEIWARGAVNEGAVFYFTTGNQKKSTSGDHDKN